MSDKGLPIKITHRAKLDTRFLELKYGKGQLTRARILLANPVFHTMVRSSGLLSIEAFLVRVWGIMLSFSKEACFHYKTAGGARNVFTIVDDIFMTASHAMADLVIDNLLTAGKITKIVAGMPLQGVTRIFSRVTPEDVHDMVNSKFKRFEFEERVLPQMEKIKDFDPEVLQYHEVESLDWGEPDVYYQVLDVIHRLFVKLRLYYAKGGTLSGISEIPEGANYLRPGRASRRVGREEFWTHIGADYSFDDLQEDLMSGKLEGWNTLQLDDRVYFHRDCFDPFSTIMSSNIQQLSSIKSLDFEKDPSIPNDKTTEAPSRVDSAETAASYVKANFHRDLNVCKDMNWGGRPDLAVLYEKAVSKRMRTTFFHRCVPVPCTIVEAIEQVRDHLTGTGMTTEEQYSLAAGLLLARKGQLRLKENFLERK